MQKSHKFSKSHLGYVINIQVVNIASKSLTKRQ